MSFFKSPDNRVHDIEPQYAFLLPPGSVPITEAEAEDLLRALAPPPAVPLVVSRAQGEIALHRAGLLPQVEAYIASATDPEVRIWWQRAQEFRRDSATLLTVAAALGWTPAQLDALFVLASEIQA